MVGTYEERMRVLDELYPTWKGYSLWEYFEENSQRLTKNFLCTVTVVSVMVIFINMPCRLHRVCGQSE